MDMVQHRQLHFFSCTLAVFLPKMYYYLKKILPGPVFEAAEPSIPFRVFPGPGSDVVSYGSSSSTKLELMHKALLRA